MTAQRARAKEVVRMLKITAEKYDDGVKCEIDGPDELTTEVILEFFAVKMTTEKILKEAKDLGLLDDISEALKTAELVEGNDGTHES